MGCAQALSAGTPQKQCVLVSYPDPEVPGRFKAVAGVIGNTAPRRQGEEALIFGSVLFV